MNEDLGYSATRLEHVEAEYKVQSQARSFFDTFELRRQWQREHAFAERVKKPGAWIPDEKAAWTWVDPPVYSDPSYSSSRLANPDGLFVGHVAVSKPEHLAVIDEPTHKFLGSWSTLDAAKRAVEAHFGIKIEDKR